MTISELTPELEAEWQAKIDKEKEDKLAQLTGGIIEKSEVKNVDGSQTTSLTISNDLHNVQGLGEASIKRLNAANIYSVDEFRKLGQPERMKILGPLVAGKLKTFI